MITILYFALDFKGKSYYTFNMRLDTALYNRLPLSVPSYYNPINVQNNLALPNQSQRQASGGVILDISPETFEASRLHKASTAELNPNACRTCESRRYQDQSDDASVSFQSPTHIRPEQSAAAVASHEAEHVANEQLRAEREGREIVYQSVTLSTDICPECKKVYVSGGVTRTSTVASSDSGEAENRDANEA